MLTIPCINQAIYLFKFTASNNLYFVEEQNVDNTNTA